MPQTINAIPLSQILAPELIPFDRFRILEVLDEYLERILVTGYEQEVFTEERGGRFAVDLSIDREVVLQLPGIGGVSLVLGGPASSTLSFGLESRPNELKFVLGGTLRLRIASELLKPVLGSNGEWVTDPLRQHTEVPITAAMIIDSDWNFEFDGPNEFTLAPCMIGQSGCVIEGTVAIDLSENRALPETLQAGLPPTWRGLIFKDFVFHLPEDFSVPLAPDKIKSDDFHIGSGGVTGSIIGDWVPELLADGTAFTGNGAGEILGIPFGLSEIAIEFMQNTFVESRIEGMMILPFFDQPVACTIGLTIDGGFTVGISALDPWPPGITPPKEENGLYVYTKEELVTLRLRSLALERQDDMMTVILGGDIKPLIGDYEWPEFQVDALAIDSNGNITLGDVWAEFDPAKVFEPMDGVALELSKVGFGSGGNGARWIGFYAGLKLAELPLSGSVEGLRINWRGNDVWLSLEGASVGFELPDTVAFNGKFGLVQEGGDIRGFRGGGRLTVIPTKLVVDAEIVVARIPGGVAIYNYANVQLPFPIPIGNTGAAFFGFGGLFGIHMGPKKKPKELWWEDWYLKPEPGVADSRKWEPQRGSFALGAGTTIGTASDNGYAVNARLLLVVVVPGPVIMLEGVLAFLQDRVKLSEYSPIKAFSLYDGRTGEFLMNSMARYPFDPQDDMRKVITAAATTEFYANSSGKWHFFMGQKEPPNKRMQAQILQLFEANSYFMILPDRIEFGAWIGFNRKWKYGPLKINLRAWIEMAVLLSWRPSQFAGSLNMVGDVCLRAFGFGACLIQQTIIECQGPNPYIVRALFKFKLKLPRLPDPKAKIKWEYVEPTVPPRLNPLVAAGVEHLKVGERWPLELNSPQDRWPTIPMDGKVAISFSNSMNDMVLAGINPPGVPPNERAGNYEFQYRLVEITLQRRSRSAASNVWQTAASKTVDGPDTNGEALWGTWQAVDRLAASTQTSSNPPATILLLGARSAFEIARDTSDDSFFDHFADYYPDFGWARVNPPRETCFDFDDLIKGEGIKDYPLIRRGDVLIDSLLLRVAARYREHSPVRLVNLLFVRPTAILFPEPIREVTLTFEVAYLRIQLFNGSDEVGEELGGTEVRSDEGLTITLRAKDNLDWTTLVFNSLDDITDWRPVIFRINYKYSFSDPSNTPLDPEYPTRLVGSLSQVCYVTAEENERHAAEVATADHAENASGQASCRPAGADLFEPDSYYRLSVVTEVRRRPLGGEWQSQRFGEGDFFNFQTAFPPGVFDEGYETGTPPEDQTQLYPTDGLLKDLRPYIDTDINDVEILTPREGSVAVYRNYDIGAEFNEPYVEPMYIKAGIPVTISVYDSNGHKAGVVEPGLANAGARWRSNDDNGEEKLSRAEKQHLAVADRAYEYLEQSGLKATGTKTARIDPACAPPATGLWVGGDDLLLKPRTLYRACIEPVRPQIVFHLDDRAKLRQNGAGILYDNILSNGENLTSVVADPAGLDPEGTRVKLLSDGNNFILYTSDPEEADSLISSVDWASLRAETAETLDAIASRPPLRPVFQWSFVTSRFATFVHHMHSIVDAAWDRQGIVGIGANGNLTQNQQNQLASMIQADDPNLYATAVDIFGVDETVQLPERLEVQILEDDNGRYGFLIESPEPIDWRQNSTGRVSLEVEYSLEAMDETTPAYGIVKFIDCNLDDPEWVEILIQNDLDLAGYKIQHASGALDADYELQDYYEFPEGSFVRAGTIVRVYRGNDAAGTEKPERTNWFANRSTSLLKNTGELLALLEPGGSIIHQRHFLPESAFSKPCQAGEVVLAYDADGTRTFVFFIDSATANLQIPDGSYRLHLTYRRRDAGEDRPVLRRSGSTESEEAVIEFNVPAELP